MSVSKQGVLAAFAALGFGALAYFSHKKRAAKAVSGVEDGKARFSAAAETWDLVDRHQLLVQKGLELMRSKLNLDAKQTDVIEFGCGTGKI
jgi:hypothetical protein